MGSKKIAFMFELVLQKNNKVQRMLVSDKKAPMISWKRVSFQRKKPFRILLSLFLS